MVSVLAAFAAVLIALFKAIALHSWLWLLIGWTASALCLLAIILDDDQYEEGHQ